MWPRQRARSSERHRAALFARHMAHRAGPAGPCPARFSLGAEILAERQRQTLCSRLPRVSRVVFLRPQVHGSLNGWFSDPTFPPGIVLDRSGATVVGLSLPLCARLHELARRCCVRAVLIWRGAISALSRVGFPLSESVRIYSRLFLARPRCVLAVPCALPSSRFGACVLAWEAP